MHETSYLSRSKYAGPNAGAWRQTLSALILLLVLILILYRDSALAMVQIWYRSETFTHGFLVPLIVMWLVWRKRQSIGATAPTPWPAASVLVAGAAFVWLLGELAAVNAVTQFALVAMVVFAVSALVGSAVARLVLFPLGFLFFCVPIGEFLLPQLMEWTADFTVLALRLSGIPVYREGLQFVIPSGNWSVVEACSGVRYLIASLTVGTLFAYLNYRSIKKRWLFALVSVIVPVLANWLRAYLIVMLGHLSGNKLAAGVDHLIYGWIFFGIVIMMMFMIGARWADTDVRVSEDISLNSDTLNHFSGKKLWICSAGLAALLASPQLALLLILKAEMAGPVSLKAPQVLATGWELDPTTKGKVFNPAYKNPAADFNAAYSSADRRVGLYLAYYRNQSYERKLVSSSNVLVGSDDAIWSRIRNGSRTISMAGKPVNLRLTELRTAALAALTGEERIVVAQIYWINGTLTASDYLAKVYSALYRLAGRGDDSAVIIVYAAKDQPAGGEALLESFLATNYPAINEILLKVRGSR